MNAEDIKSVWDSVEAKPRYTADIIRMAQEKTNPVFRSIRRQLAIEILGWALLLFCYYSMFDGDDKPLLINIIFIICITIPLIHNLYGYKVAKNIADATDILTSLGNHIKNVSAYSKYSIASRLIFTGGIMLFFSYNVNFDSLKNYMLIGAFVTLISIQATMLFFIWQKRIKGLKHILNEFNG